MKFAMIGYGRMGREIKCLGEEKGHQVPVTVDPHAPEATHKSLSAQILSGLDGVIEFALPQGTLTNLKTALEAKVPMVIGTTGWDDQLEKARKMTLEAGGCVVYGSNYSIGAHIFFQLVEEGARLINAVDDYDIMLVEHHHKNKVDSPSGTALTTAGRILKALERKTRLETSAIQGAIAPEALHVASVRGGSIPGIHHVSMDSPMDTVEIIHTARSRQGFALGSLLALSWAQGKKGFFPVEDFIQDFLNL